MLPLNAPLCGVPHGSPSAIIKNSQEFTTEVSYGPTQVVPFYSAELGNFQVLPQGPCITGTFERLGQKREHTVGREHEAI
jgi:hypothetical protein